MSQAGTTCPTIAEDALADAFSRTTAWQALTGSADETEALQKIYFNSQPLPVDNNAFTLDELLERGVAMLILMDTEEGFVVTPGEAQGVVYEGGRVLAIIERWIPESEQNDPAVDQNRYLLDKIVDMMVDATDYLLSTKGQRWMQPMRLVQPPLLNEDDESQVKGRWQQATIAMNWGQNGESTSE